VTECEISLAAVARKMKFIHLTRKEKMPSIIWLPRIECEISLAAVIQKLTMIKTFTILSKY